MSSLYRSSVRKQKLSGVGVIVLFLASLAFLGFGAVIFYQATIHPLLQVRAATRWPEVSCVIDSSQVDEFEDTKEHSSIYKIYIVFHYTFNGRTYRSSRYQFSESASNDHTDKQRIVDRYPPGKNALCYVDPADPSMAVLYRGVSGEMAIGLAGVLSLFIGVLGLYQTPGRIAALHRSPAEAMPAFTVASAELRRLKLQSSPLRKFLGTFGALVFFAALAGALCYHTFLPPDSIDESRFSHQLIAVFSALFAIGLGAYTLRTFLQLFNPRILLKARADAVALGGVFDFEWSVRGRAAVLRKLRIVLEGQEQATYWLGKHEHTETLVFAEIPVCEIAAEELQHRGALRAVVPAGFMHTFCGRKNRIVWRLRVRGEVPNWPPIEEDFPLHILPSRVTI